MAEKEELGIGAAIFELRKRKKDDFAGGAFFEGGVEGVGVARAEGTEGGEDNGFVDGGRIVREGGAWRRGRQLRCGRDWEWRGG